MFHYRLLPHEAKEKASIERRRILEEERRKRIFNTKQRIIGVDEVGIRQQIEEKKRQNDRKKINEKKYHESQMYAVEYANRLEKDLNEKKKRVNEELKEFWKTRQGKRQPSEELCQRKELGISSGQLFEGEDEEKKRRQERQREQQKAWLVQQMRERQRLGEEWSRQECYSSELAIARDQRLQELARLEEDCRRELAKAFLNYNQALNRENKYLMKIQNQKETNEKRMEILNTVNSDFMTENPETAQSNLGPYRVIPYQYKGMSDEERLAIRQDQLKQIEKNKERRDMDAAFNKRWNNFIISVDNIAAEKSEVAKYYQREQESKNIQDNILISRDKLFRLQEERKSKNSICSKEFLNKFNQSSR